MFNIPGVAGAVLQTPSSLIDWAGDPFDNVLLSIRPGWWGCTGVTSVT